MNIRYPAVSRRFPSIAACLLAIASATALCQSSPSSAADQFQRGEAALASNRPQEAMRDFQAALLQSAPQSTAAQASRGILEWMGGDCASAAHSLAGAHQLAPADAMIEGLLGICEKRLGQNTAETHLRDAFSRLKNKSMRLAVGVELGDLFYERGDLDEAVPVTRSLVELDPENIDVLFFAQHVYQQMADDTMNKLALLAPNSARMQQLVAERLVNAGDLKRAIEHYQAALQLDPNLPGAHFELAEALLESTPQNPIAQQESERELRASLRLDGETPRIECELGQLSYVEGKLDLALAHYERAYALDPHEVEAAMGTGRILMAQNKPEQALRYLSEAATRDPLNSEAHYQYARALKQLHRNAEAEQQMKIFEAVRAAQSRLRELYSQMNKRIVTPAGEIPPAEENQP